MHKRKVTLSGFLDLLTLVILGSQDHSVALILVKTLDNDNPQLYPVIMLP